MSTLGDIRTAAVNAFDDGDYTEALKQCEKGLAYLALTPDTSKDGGSLGWSRDAIDKLIDHILSQQAASKAESNGFLQTTNMKYKRTGTS